MTHEKSIGNNIDHASSKEAHYLVRGRSHVEHLDGSQKRGSEMWQKFVPVIKKHLLKKKDQERFRNPSGDYSLDRIINHVDFSPQDLRSFVDDCSALLEMYGEYAEAAKLWGAVYKKKMFIGSALKECQRLYDEAMTEGLHGQAETIAKSDIYLVWFRGTKSEVGLSNLTRATEEHARDVIGAHKLIAEGDSLAKKWKQVLQMELEYLFLTYAFSKDAYEKDTVYYARKDGYTSVHPSEIALEVARQYCDMEAQRGVYGMLFARGDAKKAGLDVHDPEYFKELMKKTALAERIKAKVKTMFEKRNEKRSLARE